MYESISTLDIQPGKLAEFVTLLRSFIFPILRRQPGLLSLALLPHPEQNRVTILSIWANRACARAIESMPEYRREIRKLDTLVVESQRNTGQNNSPKVMERQALSYN